MSGLKRVLILAILMTASLTNAQAPGLVFIVNLENPSTTISASDLRDFYFKRKRSWPDGTGVRFIDRTTGSALRQEFTRSILQKKVDEIDMYWIGQKLYSGDSAPLQESSDAMTIRFVESFKGAIGYVSTSTDLTEKKVKVVKVGP
ncbi:MAG: substrate-binding domain-containing protein [Bdellovibrionota bacterium]